MMNVIAKILKATVTTHTDTGQTIADVTWRDSRGRTGTTSGDPTNPHMQALLARATREGVPVERMR